MQFERAASVDSRRVLAAATGATQFSKLTPEERAIAHCHDPAAAVAVAARVRAGGHGVPSTKLADRYQRLWPLICEALSTCHRVVFYDNAHDDGPTEVASYRYGVSDYAPQWPDWAPARLMSL